MPRLLGIASVVFLTLGLLGYELRGAVPPAEKLLPPDTLLVATAPDAPALTNLWQVLPHYRLWASAGMKAFRDKFAARWDEDFLKPLDRELNVNLNSWASLVRGQVTLALTRNGWTGTDERVPGFLLLLDSRDRSAQLTTNLHELRKQWREAGKTLRTEKIRDFEFTALPISTNDLPAGVRQFFPRPMEFQEAGAPEPVPRKEPAELVFGQAGSLLILGNSVSVVEQVVARLAGGALPCLAEAGGFESAYGSQLKNRPFYVWADVKTWAAVHVKQAAARTGPEAPSPVDVLRPEKLIAASGLAQVNAMTFTAQKTPEGLLLQAAASTPEASRQGVFKLLTAQNREWGPPPFIASGVTRFERWRLDGPKTAEGLAAMLNEIAPQSLNGLNLILNTAHDAAKLKEPTFDLKATLASSLGDDIVWSRKAPTPDEPGDGPALLLLGSPAPEKLAAALKGIFLIFPEPPTEREFLGRKISSVPLPPMPFLTGSAPAGPPRTLHFAAGGSYVALSTDAAFVEEYLRSAETKAKPLRELAGFTEAAQQVVAPNTAFFGYVNQAEGVRAQVEQLRQQPALLTNAPPGFLGTLASVAGLAAPEKSWHEWMDLDLLPASEALAKSFHFYVFALTANSDGMACKWFWPNPPPGQP